MYEMFIASRWGKKYDDVLIAASLIYFEGRKINTDRKVYSWKADTVLRVIVKHR